MVRAILKTWIKSTEIEQECKMAYVPFYLALKGPFGLPLSLKYNQATATWHKLKRVIWKLIKFLEMCQVSSSVRALTTQPKSNFKRMQTQPLSRPNSEKNTLRIPSGSLCRS